MPLQITSFAPTEGPVDTEVTLTVAGLPPDTPVDDIYAYIGDFPILRVAKDSDTEIVVTIPENAQTGPIILIAGGLDAQSPTSFTVTGAEGQPRITNISPPTAMAGGMVTLTGNDLDQVQAIWLGPSLRVPTFNLINAGTLQFRVPATTPAASYWVYGQTLEYGRIRSPRMLQVATAAFAA